MATRLSLSFCTEGWYGAFDVASSRFSTANAVHTLLQSTEKQVFTIYQSHDCTSWLSFIPSGKLAKIADSAGHGKPVEDYLKSSLLRNQKKVDPEKKTAITKADVICKSW